jgi:alpha-galactosidase
MKKIYLLIQATVFTVILNAQDYAVWKDNKLTLDNGVIKRELSFENGNLVTQNLILKGNDFNFVKPQDDFDRKMNSFVKEFSILIDGKYYDGLSGWQFVSCTTTKDSRQGQGAVIRLKGLNEISSFEVAITYLLYPQLPVIRKQITVYNQSAKEIKIESLDVEKLKLNFSYIPSVSYANYGRQKHLSTYIGNWDDAVIAVHSYEKKFGNYSW